MFRGTILVLASCTFFLAGAAASKTPPEKPKAKPKLSVIELGQDKQLKFAGVTNPTLSLPLTIESDTPLKGVVVTSTQFLSATAEPADVTVDPKSPFDIEKQQVVRINATLLDAGTYSCMVTIQPKGADVVRFPIEVTRTTAAPPVTFGDIASVNQQVCLFRRSATVPVSLNAYATGAAVTVPGPSLESITRKVKADAAAGSLAGSVKLDPSQISASILVKPGEPAPINLALTGIELPGRYDGVLRFAPPGYTPVSKTFSVFVREPFWLAIIFIILGIAVSLIVLIYGSTLRPRLLAQEHVTSLLLMLRTESTRAAGDADADRLVTTVRQNIRSLWTQKQQRRSAVTTEFDVFDTVVPAVRMWIDCHRQFLTVQPREAAATLKTTLDSAAQTLAAATPDANAVRTAVTSLSQFSDNVRTAVTSALSTAINGLQNDLAQSADAKLQEIEPLVQKASEALLRQDTATAIDLVRRARLRYATVVAGLLLERLKPATPPDGMEPAQWEELKRFTTAAAAMVQTTDDPDVAMSRLLSAAGPFVREVGGAIATSATASIQDGQKRKDVLDAVSAATEAVKKSAADGLQKLDAAARLYQSHIAAPGQPMGLMSDALASLATAALGAPGAGAAFDVVPSFVFGPTAAQLDQPDMVTTVRRQITAFDFVVSAIVLVVACLIGVQVLWLDNLTWGGWGNYLIAFLWGFSLDQFSHAGLNALRR